MNIKGGLALFKIASVLAITLGCGGIVLTFGVQSSNGLLFTNIYVGLQQYVGFIVIFGIGVMLFAINTVIEQTAALRDDVQQLRQGLSRLYRQQQNQQTEDADDQQ